LKPEPELRVPIVPVALLARDKPSARRGARAG
jgi:hypothetical protein